MSHSLSKCQFCWWWWIPQHFSFCSNLGHEWPAVSIPALTHAISLGVIIIIYLHNQNKPPTTWKKNEFYVLIRPLWHRCSFLWVKFIWGTRWGNLLHCSNPILDQSGRGLEKWGNAPCPFHQMANPGLGNHGGHCLAAPVPSLPDMEGCIQEFILVEEFLLEKACFLWENWMDIYMLLVSTGKVVIFPVKT